MSKECIRLADFYEDPWYWSDELIADLEKSCNKAVFIFKNIWGGRLIKAENSENAKWIRMYIEYTSAIPKIRAHMRKRNSYRKSKSYETGEKTK